MYEAEVVMTKYGPPYAPENPGPILVNIIIYAKDWKTAQRILEEEAEKFGYITKTPAVWLVECDNPRFIAAKIGFTISKDEWK
jgi:hypothetical protein